jgi:hypothetical protein
MYDIGLRDAMVLKTAQGNNITPRSPVENRGRRAQCPFGSYAKDDVGKEEQCYRLHAPAQWVSIWCVDHRSRHRHRLFASL